MSKSREKRREHILSKEKLEGTWNISMDPNYAREGKGADHEPRV